MVDIFQRLSRQSRSAHPSETRRSHQVVSRGIRVETHGWIVSHTLTERQLSLRWYPRNFLRTCSLFSRTYSLFSRILFLFSFGLILFLQNLILSSPEFCYSLLLLSSLEPCYSPLKPIPLTGFNRMSQWYRLAESPEREGTTESTFSSLHNVGNIPSKTWATPSIRFLGDTTRCSIPLCCLHGNVVDVIFVKNLIYVNGRLVS